MATKTYMRHTRENWKIHNNAQENIQKREQFLARQWGNIRNQIEDKAKPQQQADQTAETPLGSYIFAQTGNRGQYRKIPQLLKVQNAHKPDMLTIDERYTCEKMHLQVQAKTKTEKNHQWKTGPNRGSDRNMRNMRSSICEPGKHQPPPLRENNAENGERARARKKHVPTVRKIPKQGRAPRTHVQPLSCEQQKQAPRPDK